MDLSSLAEIGVLMGVATFVSIVMRFLRQPLIIGHIITGILVGRYAIGILDNIEMIELFSHLGISFLLFSVGLSLNPQLLKQYGKASVLNTFGQVFLTGGAGVIVCLLLGFNWVTSLYVGIAISFSSTVIVLKLLADKGDLDKLYVKVSIGSLLLQDLLAIILLFALPIVAGSTEQNQNIIITLGLGVIAGIGTFVFANTVIRYLNPYLSKSQELLFLFGNAWAICIAILFHNLGFSLEGGALIAGVALANLPSSREISARLTPLRDFFIVAFFILLGTRLVVDDFNAILVPAIVLSLFVLLINPLIQLIVMGVLGYRKKTSFQTGMMAAQVSEFSLILVGLGVSLNQVDPSVLSTITLVGIFTIFISTYLIYYSDSLYEYTAPFLGLFEKKHVRERLQRMERFPVVLIGGGRISYDFIRLFEKNKTKFLIVDHDPENIKKLKERNIRSEYGDVSDPDFLTDLKLNEAQLIISTISDFESNRIILSTIKLRQQKIPQVWVVTHRVSNALDLYDAGADYVILPHFLGGKYAANLLRRFTKGDVSIPEVKERHIAQLQDRERYISQNHLVERLR